MDRATGFAAALLVGISLTITAHAEENSGLKPTTAVEGITEYQLENGLKVLLFPDASMPRVTVNITVFVGSRHEGYGEAGMAHLLEHMLFKGTPTHSEIPKLLTARGANFNGTTWLDRTNYYETLPASDDNLEFALKLEADRLVNSLVKAEDLESEMTVVRNEFESGENRPMSVLSQRMRSAAFQWHNYGQSTIGNRADIERVPIESLQSFYRKYYRPDNAMLIVAGKFDSQKALELIQKYYAPLENPETPLPQTWTEEPAQDGEKIVTLRRVGEVATVGAIYHIPAGPHPEFVAVDVLEGILTSEPSGRLYKALVETKKASAIYGAAYALHDPGYMLLLAPCVKGNDSDVVLNAMLDELETVREKGVTEDEVERIRQKLLKRRELEANNSRGIAIQLSEWAAQGDWRLYFLYRDRLEKVTAEQVSAAAKKYLQRNNRTVGVFIPTEQSDEISIPATPELAEMIGEYKGRETVSAGEEFDVAPLAIEERVKRLKIGGLETVLLPRKTRGEEVSLRVTLRFGTERSLRNQTVATDLLATLMTRGTKKLSRQQLQDALDQYRVQLSATAEAGAITFSLKTRNEFLPEVIGLLGQILREPALDEGELGILQRETITALEQQLKEPQSLATQKVRRELYQYDPADPRYVATMQEKIARTREVTTDLLRHIHDDYIGSQAGELVLLGEFDEQQVLPQLKELFSDWLAPQKYERLAHTIPQKIEGNYSTINTPGKANAMYFGATAFPVSDSHPDYPALVIGNFILGGGSLSSRLGDRVRQQDGLSYGVGSGFQARSVDERAAFYVYAIANPQNIPKVHAAIREELERIRKDGVTAEELAAAQDGYLQKEEVSRSSPGSLAATLADTAEAGRTMQYYETLEQKIRSLSTDDVAAALRKYIDPKNLVIVAAGDFEQPAAPKEAPTGEAAEQKE